jgi:hypothetical protein
MITPPPPPDHKATTEIRVNVFATPVPFVADEDVTLANFKLQAAKTKIAAEANMKKTGELSTAITSAIDTGRLRTRRHSPDGLK